jgi:hypothetical protein
MCALVGLARRAIRIISPCPLYTAQRFYPIHDVKSYGISEQDVADHQIARLVRVAIQNGFA